MVLKPVCMLFILKKSICQLILVLILLCSGCLKYQESVII